MLEALTETLRLHRLQLKLIRFGLVVVMALAHLEVSIHKLEGAS
jgi:hypothetical protein